MTAAPAPIPRLPEVEREQRHNFAMGVLDGGFFGLAIGLASYVTVLPLFVHTLSDSAILIGSISAIRMAGWQLPQLLTVNRVARLGRYKPMVLAMSTFERLPFLGLAVVALLAPWLPRPLVLALTFGLLLVHGLAGGLTATAWQAMIGKVTAPTWRGRFFGLQSAAASVMGSLGALAAGAILAGGASSRRFALCFLLASAALAVSWLFLSRVREVDAPPSGPTVGRREAWSRWGNVLRRDGGFRWFVVARGLSQIPLTVAAFLTVYAVERFGIGTAFAGALAALYTVAQASGSLTAGWIGDRRGHRVAMAAGVAALTAAALLAIAAPREAWLVPAFVLAGAGAAAVWTSPLAMTLAFGAESDRPGYIGLSNSLIAPATIAAPLLGGWLAEASGYDAAFALAAAGGVATFLVLALCVRDPGGRPDYTTSRSIAIRRSKRGRYSTDTFSSFRAAAPVRWRPRASPAAMYPRPSATALKKYSGPASPTTAGSMLTGNKARA